LQKRTAAAKKGQKVTKKFIINASNPVNDKIFDLSAFEKFLHDRIKVDGRTGNLTDQVSISQQGDGKIEVIAHQEFSGRYLKYLYVIRIQALNFGGKP
jgi:large subunit ribosomal protein L22e